MPPCPVLCASLAHALVRRDSPRFAFFACSSSGGVALAVDVLPAWGADFGGPIALVPALGFLLMDVMGSRTSARNLGDRRGFAAGTRAVGLHLLFN